MESRFDFCDVFFVFDVAVVAADDVVVIVDDGRGRYESSGLGPSGRKGGCHGECVTCYSCRR